MPHLLVEELEPRQLLNGTGFGYEPPSIHPLPDHSDSGGWAERAPVVDPGSPDRLTVEDGPGGGVTQVRPSRDISFADFAAARPETLVPASPTARYVYVVEPEEVEVFIIEPAVGQPAPRPVAAGPALGRPAVIEGPVVAAAAPAAAYQPPPSDPATAGTGSGVAGAAASLTPAARSSLQIVQQSTSAGLPASHTEGPVLAIGSTVTGTLVRGDGHLAGSETGKVVVAVGPLHVAPTPGGADPAEDRPAEAPLVLPAMRLPGVLAVLPAPDLAALERGMQRFLEQLGRIGAPLGLAADEMGPGLWIAAAAAAAVACEMARRQWRRPVEVPPMPGGPRTP